jgi:uncharacterized protein YndB with AHSA1/START domain
VSDSYSPVPELDLLKEFQDRLGEEYAGEFWLHDTYGDASHLGALEEVRQFRERLIPFAQANSSGSFFALWRRDDREDFATLPVIFCDDEGDHFIAASTLRDLLRLLTLDHAVFSRQRAGHHAPGHHEFVTWLDHRFGLTSPESPDSLFATAVREHGRPFADWWMSVDPDDGILEDLLDELEKLGDCAIYLDTGPEQVWLALTDPALTRRCLGVSFETDWRAGSAMAWVEHGTKTVDPAQVVLEAEAGRRLSYTWRTFTPEWAEATEVSDELFARLTRERRPKVTFEIEPLGQVVKLTVVHEGFEPGSGVAELLGDDYWPCLLCDLKGLLESGEPLSTVSGDVGNGG